MWRSIREVKRYMGRRGGKKFNGRKEGESDKKKHKRWDGMSGKVQQVLGKEINTKKNKIYVTRNEERKKSLGTALVILGIGMLMQIRLKN